MVRFGLFFAAWLSTPAFAAPPLEAEVLLVVPNHSGNLPAELKPMRGALASKGYDGARVEARREVVLREGQPAHVELGKQSVDLELLSVGGEQAQVRVTRPGQPGKVTTVSTTHTRFFVTVPAPGR
jgi:hypothetical protein